MYDSFRRYYRALRIPIIAIWAATYLIFSTFLQAHAQEDALPALDEQSIEQSGLDVRLKRVEAYLRDIDTLQADFVQIADDGTINRGIVSMDRPGRVRFEYTDDTPLLLVSDGDVLSFIDYDIGQVTRWPIKDTPLRILVSKNVDLRAANTIVNSLEVGERTLVLVSARNPEQPDEGAITLMFEDHGGERLSLEGWEIVDGQGKITQLRLSDQKVNLTLDDKALWAFKDPRKLPSQRRRRAR